MKAKLSVVAIVVTATGFLAGCANPPEQQVVTPGYPATYPTNNSYYGVVESIQLMPAEPTSRGPGVGAIVGGVVGGLLGNQVGGGTGKGIATVAGVVGGAVVGNQVEQRNRVQASDSYQVSVRLNSGSYQTFQRNNIADLHPGSRVRIDNGLLYPY
jgi:outer membrane lipoprotein SlyB